MPPRARDVKSAAKSPRARNPRDPAEVLRARKEPDFQQERARRSYLGLIEAAETLFAAHGFDATGTPEIAEAAGVSVGTFYRYFDDKNEIYLEIARRNFFEIYQQTLEGLTPARFAGLARHETIANSVTILFAHVLKKPALTRSFNEMALRDPAVAELRRAVDEVALGRLTELITASIPRSVAPDPAATAFVLYGSAMQCAYAVAEHYGAPAVSAERARAALVAFIERALFP